jgi:hypothetical protein
MQIIQNAIRAGVYSQSDAKIIIPPPNIDALSIIMRSYFLSYVQYTENMREEIQQLNQRVIDYCVKELFSASNFYIQYIQDQRSMYMPLKLPLQPDRNKKQLQPRFAF